MPTADIAAAPAQLPTASRDVDDASLESPPTEVAHWSASDLAALQGRVPEVDEMVDHARTMSRDDGLAALSDQDLEQHLVAQTVRIAAATSRWLDLLAEVVVRGIWADQGSRSPTAWLSWRLGLAPSTAREHIRVALRLRELPRIHARFATGSLSYSKVRALTRIAVPELQQLLLTWSDSATGADLDRIARSVTRARRQASVERARAPEQRAERAGLDVLVGDEGQMELRWRLDVEAGMEVLAVLDRLLELEDEAAVSQTVDVGTRDEVAGSRAVGGTAARPSLRQRQGEVLHRVLLAARDQTPPDTSGLDRHTLVLQVAARDLAADGSRHVPVGVGARQRARPTMSAAALRRLACEAGVVLIPTDGRGTPIDVGRRRRRPTAALRRALLLRDRSCRFPGCDAVRHLHAHHVVHWADGGPTDLHNLLLLCGAHHRTVHEPGWSLSVTASGRVAVRPARAAPSPSTSGAPPLPPRPPLPIVPRLPGADGLGPGASAEALPTTSTTLAPHHWSADDPLQLDLIVSLIEQELVPGSERELTQVA